MRKSFNVGKYNSIFKILLLENNSIELIILTYFYHYNSIRNLLFFTFKMRKEKVSSKNSNKIS